MTDEAAKADVPPIVVAKKTFHIGDLIVHKGTFARLGHDITVGRENLFEEIKVRFDYDFTVARRDAERLGARKALEAARKAEALAQAASEQVEGAPEPPKAGG